MSRARPPQRYAVSTSASGAGSLDLPPFPEIDETTPFEDALLILKERLAQLYERLGPGEGSP